MEPDPGLCQDCAFFRIVENRRGSRFVLCRLSETDPAFRKYPRLPVVECSGYECRREDTKPSEI